MTDRDLDFDNIAEYVNYFNEKHGLETKDQGLMLGAEEGELADAVLKEDKEAIKEEIGDVIFVAVSIAELEGIDALEAFDEVTQDNLGKDASKEGSKVTKE